LGPRTACKASVRESPFRFAVIFFGVAVSLLFLWASRSIFVISFLGLLFGVAIMPAVAWLHRFHVPAGLGATIIVAAVLALLIGVGILLTPVLRRQTGELRERIPMMIDRIDRALQGRAPLSGTLSQQMVALRPYLFPVFSTTLSAVTGLLLVIFLTIFFAAKPGVYRDGMLHLVPASERARIAEVLTMMGHALRAWVVARSIAMVTIGVVVTAAMALLSVRAAVALGVIAGLLEFVPMFGPVLGAIPAIALALVDSPQKALAVSIAFLIIQQLEGNVLIPLLLQKAVEVPPALTLIGIASLAIVLGVPGVLIAEPLVAVTLVAVKMLYVEPVLR
jgi:predicted PurR-regulated permease PerM